MPNEEKQLTAVDWLIENMPNLSHKIGFGLALEITAKFQQAKKIERQQLIDAYWAGLNGSMNDYSETKVFNNEMIGVKNGGGAEQYYTQTFKTQ